MQPRTTPPLCKQTTIEACYQASSAEIVALSATTMGRFLRCSLVLLCLVVSVYTTPISTSSHDAYPQRVQFALAPLMASYHPHGTINDSYIIVLKKDVSQNVLQNHFNFLQMAHEADPLTGELSGLRHTYSSNILGYSGRFTNGVLDLIRAMPEVDYVERDQIVRTMDVQKQAPWVSNHCPAAAERAVLYSLWQGLARISHRPKLTLGTFTKYEYSSDGGVGVDVYVIDTGINIGHVEFEGRASWGATIPQNDVDEDGNGHGTHCVGGILSDPEITHKLSVMPGWYYCFAEIRRSQGGKCNCSESSWFQWQRIDVRCR